MLLDDSFGIRWGFVQHQFIFGDVLVNISRRHMSQCLGFFGKKIQETIDFPMNSGAFRFQFSRKNTSIGHDENG